MATKRRFGPLELPLQRIHLELTNLCEFDCLFCPKSEMTRAKGFMATELARRTITEIGRLGLCEKVTFHVMGEPTLHPDLLPILEHARAERVAVGLTTNGARLGGEIGRQLLAHELHQIDVSLQTPDARCFALRRAGRLSFDDYLDGILRFFAAYRERHGARTRFKFRFLNTRFRQKSMEARLGPIRVISSTAELRATFRDWANRLYDILDVDTAKRRLALAAIDKLVAWRWNVVEIHPNVFFETYVLDDWGHAFSGDGVRDAWAGYCFGMRDHFAVLHNGDVTLCCMDYDGKTAVGNLHERTLAEVLASPELGEIVDGFRRYRVVHPYCKKCLGSRSLASWLFKPVVSVAGLKLLKPFFYRQARLFDDDR